MKLGAGAAFLLGQPSRVLCVRRAGQLRFSSSQNSGDKNDSEVSPSMQRFATFTKGQEHLAGKRVDGKKILEGKDPWGSVAQKKEEEEKRQQQTGSTDRYYRQPGTAIYKNLEAERENYAAVKARVMDRRASRPQRSAEATEAFEELEGCDIDSVTAEAHFFASEADLPTDAEAAYSGVYDCPDQSEWLVTVDEANYEEVVEQEKMPMIIDFWATHCTDSVAMSTSLKLFVELINSNGVKIKLGQLECNANYALTLHMDVHSLPTALAIRETHVLEEITGLVDEEVLAQFVFGYAQAVYGPEVLAHITEDQPLCQLIDARVALKAEDYETAFEKYSSVYSRCSAIVKDEQTERRRLADDEGVFTPEITRVITTAEAMGAKAAAGLIVTLYHQKKYRSCRAAMKKLRTEFTRSYNTCSDIRKAMATVEIMMITEYDPEWDVDDLEDEERIDQHNLDIKLKLVGAYFLTGDYRKALGTNFILIRKNRSYKDEVATLLMMRIMMYLGRHHPIRAEFSDLFEDLLHIPKRRVWCPNHKARMALNEPTTHWGSLEEEIPKMIDPTPFNVESSVARHPLLQ